MPSNAKAIRLNQIPPCYSRQTTHIIRIGSRRFFCRCKEGTGATTTLHVGVVGIEDKAYKQPDGTYGNETFYEVTVSGGNH